MTKRLLAGARSGSCRGASGGPHGKANVVVKGHYRASGNAKAIKASGRYYTTRENELGESMSRESFARDADSILRDELYQRLERADSERNYHYRLVLSPGTDQHAGGADLKEFTRQVMEKIENQQRGRVTWVAVEHGHETAHTQRAHVHAIVSTERLITSSELEAIREHANQHWELRRETQRMLEHSQTSRRDLQIMREAQVQSVGRMRDFQGPDTLMQGHEAERGHVNESAARLQRDAITQFQRDKQYQEEQARARPGNTRETSLESELDEASQSRSRSRGLSR